MIFFPPFGVWMRPSWWPPEKELKAMITSQLDCMGYDPDAVLQKLNEGAGNTVFITSDPNSINAIDGWPKKFTRTKGGIEVEWEPIAGSLFTTHTFEHHLAIYGTKSDSDFRIAAITWHRGRL